MITDIAVVFLAYPAYCLLRERRNGCRKMKPVVLLLFLLSFFLYMYVLYKYYCRKKQPPLSLVISKAPQRPNRCNSVAKLHIICNLAKFSNLIYSKFSPAARQPEIYHTHSITQTTTKQPVQRPHTHICAHPIKNRLGIHGSFI